MNNGRAGKPKVLQGAKIPGYETRIPVGQHG